MPIGGGIPEIVVRGRRINLLGGPGGSIFLPGTAPLSDLLPPGLTPAALGLFQSPAVPKVIEEIITTAPRPGPAPAPSAFGPLLARLAGPSLIGGVVALTALKITEELAEQRAAEEQREREALDAFVPRDTPVLPMRPEVIPEVVVTATGADVLRAQLQLPPQPQFIPFEADPAIMVPISPVTLPTLPQPQVEVEIAPVTAPQVRPGTAPQTRPGPAPTVAPLPLPLPLPLSDPRVFPSPGLLPQPQVQPQPAPQPLTPTQPGVLTSVGPAPAPLPQPLPLGAGQPCPPCPPCKKDEEPDKPRQRCWKKLVKETLFPSRDEEFKWTEIDCISGREL